MNIYSKARLHFMHKLEKWPVRLRESALIGMALLTPVLGWGCACGCGVFEVQTNAMLSTRPGGTVFFEYDSIDQNQNWRGTSKASSGDNMDKRLWTQFMTAGIRSMFNRRWGVAGEIPLWNRYLKTTDENGDIVSFQRVALGDVRVQGIYSGFSPDMSTGLTFGAKLPTGDHAYPNFDRDMQIGTESTDLLLGAYRMGRWNAESRWAWFASGQWDEPVLIAAGYRPGAEANLAVGGYYDDWHFAGILFAPLLQIIGSQRWRDMGPAAHSSDSGYRKMILSPGFEIDALPWRMDANVGVPVYQQVNGDQLAASVLYKLNLSYSF